MDVAELHRLVEYKFAPEPLLAVQGLANTYAFEEGDEEELIGDREAARAWLEQTGLTRPGTSVTGAEHHRLLEFRGAIRALLDSNLTGEENPRAAAALAEFAGRRPVAYVADGGGLALDLAPAATVDGVIAQMVGIAREAQLTGTWARLKICACEECRWAFYDTSRNRGGTWCQMETCGNKVNNRAYRARVRT